MIKVKKGKYDGSALLKCAASYKCVLGARDNGKSYWIKAYLVEQAFLNADSKFVFLRRWTDDVKPVKVERYFSDCPIEQLTKGEFNMIRCYRGELILMKSLGPDQYAEYRKVIGTVIPLVMEERYKSQPFEGYNAILFEEFISKKVYIPEETTFFESLISTVARDKKNLTIWMIGNTFRRSSPYYTAWGLTGILKQPVGSISIYDLDGVKFAVEKTDKTAQEQSRYFWGKQKKNIIEGEWDSDEMPHLPGSIEDYNSLYSLQINHDGLIYHIQLLIPKKAPQDEVNSYLGPLTYVSYYEGERILRRRIQKEYSPDPFCSIRLDPDRFYPEKIFIKSIKDQKVVFSDDLTGTEFNILINEYI